MKLTLGPIILLSSTALASGLTFSTAANAGAKTYEDAANYCAKDGLRLADQTEWCEYALTEAPGPKYGSAPIRDGTEFINVEAACGITEKPTPSPTTAAPLVVSRNSAPVRGGRGSRGIGRKLQESFDSILCAPAPVPQRMVVPPKASGSGDPHFKTWTGAKFDYHGECDLVLVDNPSFADGLGLRVHIRTTRVQYYSYIEQIAVQIGEDILEFNNDVENFLINGVKAEPVRKYRDTMFAGFVVRRDPKAISIRLNKDDPAHPGAKIDLIARKIGFPSVVLDAGETDVFQGSLGLLGHGSTGQRLGRDGITEIEDITTFALEWQVRDTEPLLFQEARFPQFPTVCTPPKKMMGNRLGKSHMEKEAEAVCANWQEDKEDCIFDVIATRDVAMASEE